MDARASAAWRQGGEVWRSVGSRIVMARLEWVGRGQREEGCAREKSDVFVSVICVYAPTARAPPWVKANSAMNSRTALTKCQLVMCWAISMRGLVF